MARNNIDTEALDILRDILKPGQTVYTTIRQSSSNGMSRHIEVLIASTGDKADKLPYIRNITYLVGRVLGYKRSPKTDALVVGGCGMDMGFHVVYSLSRALWPEGHKCIGDKCPSNDHSNDFGAFAHTFAEQHGHEYEAGDTYEARSAYCAARSEAYNATEKQRFSKRRVHRDGGYALRHSWA